MPRVGWDDTPEWAKEAALTVLNGEGEIERPVRIEDRGDSLFVGWGENEGYEAVLAKERLRTYESGRAE